MHLCEAVVTETCIAAHAQQTGLNRGLETAGALVGDVQHRGHLVGVASVESAGRETDRLGHVGVDEGESFLLACANEERTVYFDAIHIDGVLVEGAATHVVLTGEFVVLGHSGEGDEQGLDASGSVRQVTDGEGVDAVHLVHLSVDATYFDFLQGLRIGG